MPNTRTEHTPESVKAVARAMAAAEGLDYDEVCGYETDAEDCNSSNCIAANFEDHDADFARGMYDRLALAAIGAVADGQKYLVWSNEHKAWWGKDRCGYTRIIANAGRYDRDEALSIAGTRDGGWYLNKGNPDEIAIPEQDAIDQYADITRAQQAGDSA